MTRILNPDDDAREAVSLAGSDVSYPDTGYVQQDPRYDALLKRLGMSADNVQLTGIF